MQVRRGFTLIELLVVIAIIAILAAILFPIFKAAQDTAKGATCASNLKEIGQAAALYENDSGGIMPSAVTAPELNGKQAWYDMRYLWTGLADKYIRQMRKSKAATASENNFEMRGTFTCPAAPEVVGTFNNNGENVKMDHLRRPYGYNFVYMGGDPNATDPAKVKYYKPSKIAKPTKTIRIMEVWWYTNTAAGKNGSGSMMVYPPKSLTGQTYIYCSPTVVWPAGFHGGASDILWFDGHVTRYKAYPIARNSSDPVPATAYSDLMAATDAGGDNPYFRWSGPAQ